MDVRGLMIVPVRGSAGMVSLWCERLPSGERVGIAFTTRAGLVEVMGVGQRWIRPDERATKAMLAPLGVTRIQVNPRAVIPGVRVRVAC